mgnify:FL=1
MSNFCFFHRDTLNKVQSILLLTVVSSVNSHAFTSDTTYSSNEETIYVYREEDDKTGLIDAAVKTEVISSQDLEQGHYLDLSQALSEIPGVSSNSVERRSGAKTALIQGFGENSVLIMIDGTPVSQNSSFGFDLGQISTENIEKVEVIKGGASALYGSQAIGGVINIVTKRPEKKKELLLDISSGMGASESIATTKNAKLLYSARDYGIGHKVSFSIREQEGYDLDRDSLVEDGVAFEKINSSLYLDKKFGNNLVSINYLFFKDTIESHTSRPFGSSAFGKLDNNTNTTTHNLKLTNIRKLNNGSLKYSVNAEIISDDLNLNDNPKTVFKETYKQTDYSAYRAELTYDPIINEEHALTMGLLYKSDVVDQRTTIQQTDEVIVENNDIENKRVWAAEAFIQDNFSYGNFEISPGARLQYDSSYGTHISPKINISHFNDISNSVKLKSWLTVGTGFRAPSIKERFFTLDHSSVANYIVKGNDFLTPEKSLSLQLGEEVQFGKDHSVHANIFYNQISNLIESVEKESDTSTRIFTYENLEEVTAHGVELGSKTQLHNKLTLGMNYSYTETVNKSTGLMLTNRPLYQANTKLTYSPIEKLQLTAKANFTGKKYTSEDNTEINKSYTTMDFKVNYNFTKKLNIYLGINNFLNVTKDPAQDSVVSLTDDRPSLGQFIYTGLKVRGF